MNASSLYVTVLRLVFQNDAPNVHRLFPYLRQLLSCSVCGNLLREPFSPLNSPCQHHECKTCVGGRKILKPSCAWCRDRPDTVQNVQLRLLLQCYKSLCEYIKLTPIYEGMQSQVQINSQSNSSTADPSGVGNRNRLADIIDEGIRFKDEFKSAAGLSKATYSMLPCLYQSVVTEPPAAVTPPPPPPPPPSQPTIVHQQQIHPQQQYIINSGGQIVLQKSMHSSSSSSSSNLLLQPPQQQPLQNQHLQKIQTPGGGGLIATLSNQRSLINSNSGSSSNAPIQPQTSGGVKQMHLPSSSINNSVTTNNNRIIQTTVAANGTVYVTKSQFVPPMPIIKTVSNGSALYSVMYAGSGNKITIKRKTDSQSASSAAHAHHNQQQLLSEGHKDPVEMGKTSSHPSSSSSSAAVSSSPTTNTSSLLLQGSSGSMTSSNYVVQDGGGGDPGAGLGFKKPPMVVKSKTLAKRKGCRCGNATLTPGKLTCCGQRCPCYVESKSCIDCKCRGCRNPHRPNGFKVRPHIPELENLDFHLHAVEQQSQQQQPLMKTILNTLSIVGNQQQHAVASSSNSSSSPASSSSLVKVSNMAATSSSSNNVDDGTRMDSRLNGIIGGTRTTEGLCDLGSNLNLHSFQSGGGGNVSQGKIQGEFCGQSCTNLVRIY